MKINEILRPCPFCGSEVEPSLLNMERGGVTSIEVRCRSVTETSASRAWYAWDYYDLQEDEENLTIYNMMKTEAGK